ncbi:MAG: hypothetical protein K8H88_06050 [Sandaracinaceae bacterium]|nr:hypothetical protein [Sandaracinaceae bacterium]
MEVPEIEVQGGRQQSALDEAHQVAEWAEPTTPEWVRCMGALWEASRSYAGAEALEKRYRSLLREMLTTDSRALVPVRSDPKQMISLRLDDLEVVVRQLRERSYFVAAALAAEVGTEIFPSESWVLSVAANCERQAGNARRGLELDRRCAELLEAAGSPEARGAWKRYARAALLCKDLDADTLSFALRKLGVPDATVDAIVAPRADRTLEAGTELSLQILRLERLMRIDPDGAIGEALAHFDTLAPRDLAESGEGHAVVELLLGALTTRQDRRAVHVAQRILDAKLELWGECPAVWLERQNLGGVLAELGQIDEGRALVVDARARLAAELGDDHPHVAMCDRNLARITNES